MPKDSVFFFKHEAELRRLMDDPNFGKKVNCAVTSRRPVEAHLFMVDRHCNHASFFLNVNTSNAFSYFPAVACILERCASGRVDGAPINNVHGEGQHRQAESTGVRCRMVEIGKANFAQHEVKKERRGRNSTRSQK